MKNLTLQFALVGTLLLFAASCAAEPSVAPSVPPASTATLVDNTLPPPRPAASTAAPTRTDNPSSTPLASAPPTLRGASGAMVIAAVGAPPREITALPDFVSRALFDSLLRVNPQTGDLTPGLAERWLVSEDARTFVFILRDGIRWHDGEPLTAEDVVFTLEALSDADARLAPVADFGPLAQIAAPDSRTVSVTFREPYCAALTYIGATPILPKHRLEGKELAQVAPEDLIGTGPLVLRRWQDDTISFIANQNYWNGAPRIVDWRYRIYPSARAARDAVQRGQADLFLDSRAFESGMERIAANEFYALAQNTARTPLDDLRVRQALAMAVDRAAVLGEMGAGAAALQTSMLPDFWAHPSTISQVSFDPTRARQLLANAGWRDTDGDGIVEKDGKPFEVTLWAQAEEPRAELTAQLLREQVARVGVRAILKLTDRTLFLTRVLLQEYDLALVHFNIPLDPAQHYFWATSEDEPGYGLNVTSYSDARVDEALGAGNRAPRCEPTARKHAYSSAFQQLAQDVPMVFLFAPPLEITADARVQGVAPSPFAGAYWNLNAWEVTP